MHESSVVKLGDRKLCCRNMGSGPYITGRTNDKWTYWALLAGWIREDTPHSYNACILSMFMLSLFYLEIRILSLTFKCWYIWMGSGILESISPICALESLALVILTKMFELYFGVQMGLIFPVYSPSLLGCNVNCYIIRYNYIASHLQSNRCWQYSIM